jgi:hypothetical protein
MMFINVRVTTVAQWVKTPGIHCSVAGSIPVTPRYSTNKIRNALRSTKKMYTKMYMHMYMFVYMFMFMCIYMYLFMFVYMFKFIFMDMDSTLTCRR